MACTCAVAEVSPKVKVMGTGFVSEPILMSRTIRVPETEVAPRT